MDNVATNLIIEKLDFELKELLEKLEKEPNNSNVLNSIGLNYYQKGMSYFWSEYPNFSSKSVDFLKKAKNYFEKALAIDDKLVSAWSSLGLVELRLKNFDQAKEHFRHALELDPSHAHTLVNQGAMIFNAGNPIKAREFFEKALELDPKIAVAWNNLGNVYFTQKNYDKAIECYLKAIGINPYLIQAWNAIANTYSKVGKKDKAINSYKRSLQLINSLSVIKSLAQLYFEDNRLQEAKTLYEEVLSKNPNDPQASFNLNSIKTKLGENYTISELKEKLVSDPKNTILINQLVQAYEQENNYEEAIKTLDMLIELEPTEMSYLRKGILLNETKRYENAIKDLLKALEYNQTNDLCLAALATSYMESNDLEKAEECIEKALQLNNYDPGYLNTKGLIRLHQEKIDQSISIFKKAVKNPNATAIIWLNLSRAYLKAGENAKAITAAKKAIDLDSKIKELVQSADEFQPILTEL